ncbi:MAG: MATE family efflux transporter [Lachnospiraceae bacterium]|nr:MATE family efflux transporter [Lachnospiraceae bacterium]
MDFLRKDREIDMLEGPVFKTIVIFALPILVSYLFQSLYNMVDTMIVGNVLGDNSLAAVGSTASIYELLVGFGMGLANGMTIVTARGYGSGDKELVRKSVAGCITIGLVASVVVAVLGYLILKPLLTILNTPEEIFQEAYDYISIIVIFGIVMFAYNLCSSLLRAIGNSVMPLLFLVFSSCLNIVLDLIFVLALRMGVKGAATATVLAQTVSCILCIIYLWKKTEILRPAREHFRFDRNLYKDLCSQGFAMAVMGSIVSVGSIILQYGINNLGTLTIAAHTAARKLCSFAMMPFGSMAMGAATFVSQNRGADKGERILKAIRSCCLCSVIMAAVMSVILYFTAEGIVRLISGSSEAEVIENGSMYLIINGPFYAVLGILFTLRYSLQGIGSKLLPLISSVIEFTGKALFVIFLIPHFGYMAVILCEPVLWCCMAAQLLWAYNHNPYIKETRTRVKTVKRAIRRGERVYLEKTEKPAQGETAEEPKEEA